MCDSIENYYIINLDLLGDIQVAANEPTSNESDPNQRASTDERACSKPFILKYSDQYPDREAGRSLHQGDTSDHQYSAAIDGGDNIWAPFLSKTDWEVAKWAKLRGAGSTAFSDLLKVEGVSLKGCVMLFFI